VSTSTLPPASLPTLSRLGPFRSFVRSRLERALGALERGELALREAGAERRFGAGP
jgi:hypothetical protein